MPSRGKHLTLIIAALAALVLAVATWQAWPHVVFRWRFEPLGLNAQGCLEYRHRGTGIVFVRVPAQEFWMGSSEEETEAELRRCIESGERSPDDDWREILEWEHPKHRVRVSDFLIAKYEMTQGAWRRNGEVVRAPSEDPDLPLRDVSWDECWTFCVRTGLTLPTEAQWECACRGESAGPYAGTGRLDDMGWHDGNCGDTVHPVGQKSPNSLGLYDMHGNVCEYCLDFFSADFYSKPAACELDPFCETGKGLAVRGGCYGDDAERCRSAARGYNDDPQFGDSFAGFRVAYWPLP